jgi:hypothetical protein
MVRVLTTGELEERVRRLEGADGPAEGFKRTERLEETTGRAKRVGPIVLYIFAHGPSCWVDQLTGQQVIRLSWD